VELQLELKATVDGMTDSQARVAVDDVSNVAGHFTLKYEKEMRDKR
jgi:hypothetical protein